MILKRLAFVFEPFSKVEKVAKIDQNGKRLAFTFWPKNPLELVKNDSKMFSPCVWTVFKKLKKWPKLTNMVMG